MRAEIRRKGRSDRLIADSRKSGGGKTVRINCLRRNFESLRHKGVCRIV